MNFTPLTIDQIGRKAPAVLATEPMEGASNKYSFVSTVDAIELIMQAGWYPYNVQSAGTRKASGKDGFQKHLIKFTRGETLSGKNDERFDLLLFNSHDRGSAFKLAMGVFVFVCLNGMVVGDEAMNFSHKHIGFDEEEFLYSVHEIADSGKQIASRVDDFKQIELTRQESGIYAKAAAELISDEPEKVNLDDMLRARRYEDRNNTLWKTYNKVQENLMKGGVRRQNMKRTRKIKAIDKNVKLNKALWVLTEEMSSIKTGNKALS